MASEIAELIPFLTENRKEVRKVALDHVVGLTGTPDGLELLAQTNVVEYLTKLLGNSDGEESTAKVLTVLINLLGSEVGAASVQKYFKRLCGSVMTILDDTFKSTKNPKLSQFELNKKWTIVELCAMLLTNLTQNESGVETLLQRGENIEGFYLVKLLDVFIQSTVPDVVWLATNDPTFNPDAEKIAGPELITHIGSRLVSPSKAFDDDDKALMPVAWVKLNEDPKTKPEDDVEVLRELVEILLLMATTREVRESMRKVRLYPVLRDHDDNEEDEKVKDYIYQMVEFLISDEARVLKDNGQTSSSSQDKEANDHSDEVDITTSKTALESEKDEKKEEENLNSVDDNSQLDDLPPLEDLDLDEME